MKFRLAALAPLTIALAACGSSEDASYEAEADTVEIESNEALEPVQETPVVDSGANSMESDTGSATATEPTASEEDAVEAAGENAAATAEAAMDEMMTE